MPSAELFWKYAPDPPVDGAQRGNAQRLPDGNVFIGWGSASDDGGAVRDARLHHHICHAVARRRPGRGGVVQRGSRPESTVGLHPIEKSRRMA